MAGVALVGGIRVAGTVLGTGAGGGAGLGLGLGTGFGFGLGHGIGCGTWGRAWVGDWGWQRVRGPGPGWGRGWGLGLGWELPTVLTQTTLALLREVCLAGHFGQGGGLLRPSHGASHVALLRMGPAQVEHAPRVVGGQPQCPL